MTDDQTASAGPQEKNQPNKINKFSQKMKTIGFISFSQMIQFSQKIKSPGFNSSPKEYSQQD